MRTQNCAIALCLALAKLQVQVLGLSSVDSIRASTEQCDNGNTTGCFSGCVFDIGYNCTGEIGDAS